jgi:hypothetical protein
MTSLIGTWALQDWIATDDTGAIAHPMGADATGVICYTDEGFVHVHLMAANRRLHAKPDTQDGTVEENNRSQLSHLSYSGSYRIEGDQVIHDVTFSSFPNWVPSQQVRDMDLDENRLILSAGPMLWDGRKITHRLTWVRAAK